MERRGIRAWLLLVLAIGLVGAALVGGCKATATPNPLQGAPKGRSEGVAPGNSLPGAVSAAATPTPNPGEARPTVTPAPYLGPPEGEAYLLFNQKWIEGLYNESLDINDPVSVFWYIFSRLPSDVVVYPSENYYYFILYVKGRQFWGNIRLPAGLREKGILSFAYFEFDEFPSASVQGGQRFSQAKYFGPQEGLILEEVDPFTWRVRYRGKEVTFHLKHLRQEPPVSFPLGENEEFVERTFDESGYQFFLLFNNERNYLFWVLNEEDGPVPDVLDPLPGSDDILVGRRSGFVFWVDKEHGNRKVLAGVRRLSVWRNDYYDGPFDQLADNYIDQVRHGEYMVRANPSLKGRIDKYGYYKDSERPVRVALSNYFSYWTLAEIRSFIERAKQQEDPVFYISRGGVPPPTTPTPTPAPTPTPGGTAGGHEASGSGKGP